MSSHYEKAVEHFIAWLESALPSFLGMVLIVTIGWWLSNRLVHLLRRAMTRGGADSGIVSFLCSALKTVLYIIVGLTAAAQLGMNVNTMIATLGAAGVAVGLALKENMANIAGGAQIIFTKPFRGGDYIALQNVEGTVERIEIMFTTLRTFDNREIVIPNSKVTSSVITNCSAMHTRRLDLSYLVGYDEDLTVVKQLLGETARRNSLVLNTPAPLISVGEHEENGIRVEMKLWCETERYADLYSEMQEAVKLAFEKAGITAPPRKLSVRLNSAG